MIYIDTSALIKLYLQEDGSEEMVDAARGDAVWATCRIAYAETMAALARAGRAQREAKVTIEEAKKVFQESWRKWFVVEVDQELVAKAGDLAEKCSLRGFDSVHLAAGLRLKEIMGKPITFAVWDKELWQAAKREGFPVVPEAL